MLRMTLINNISEMLNKSSYHYPIFCSLFINNKIIGIINEQLFSVEDSDVIREDTIPEVSSSTPKPIPAALSTPF